MLHSFSKKLNLLDSLKLLELRKYETIESINFIYDIHVPKSQLVELTYI